jgi:hypothetical protein
MTYLIIYQIEHPMKLNKKLTLWSKWSMGYNQVEHLVKLDKTK